MKSALRNATFNVKNGISMINGGNSIIEFGSSRDKNENNPTTADNVGNHVLSDDVQCVYISTEVDCDQMFREGMEFKARVVAQLAQNTQQDIVTDEQQKDIIDAYKRYGDTFYMKIAQTSVEYGYMDGSNKVDTPTGFIPNTTLLNRFITIGGPGMGWCKLILDDKQRHLSKCPPKIDYLVEIYFHHGHKACTMGFSLIESEFIAGYITWSRTAYDEQRYDIMAIPPTFIGYS